MLGHACIGGCGLAGWLLILTGVAAAQRSDSGCDSHRQICLAEEANGEFRENFSGSTPVRVSGNLLVGVSLAGSGGFSAQAIRVALPIAPASGRLCLAVASRDGRYFAENLYEAAAARDQARFFFPSGYARELGAYRPQDIAVLIRDTEGCGAAAFGTVLPSVEGTGPLTKLRVSLNAPATRTSIELLSGETKIGRPEGCEADPGRNSLSFSAICTVVLPDGPMHGDYQLRVYVRERMRIHEMRPIPLRIDRP